MRTDALARGLGRIAFLIVLLSCHFGCGENELGTGVANPPSSTTVKNAAAAIGAIFSGSQGDQSVAAALNIGRLGSAFQTSGGGGGCPADDPACTCRYVDESPDEVNSLSYGTPGTYGAVGNEITLTAADFCTLADGTENSGLGPDGRGRFATFTIIEDVAITCTGGSAASISMKSGSTGIHRNTVATQTEPSYHPQIFGTFLYDADGTQVPVDCTMGLAEDETILFADCTDEEGNEIELDDSASCQVNSRDS